MTLRILIGLALQGLRRQKVRTALTLVGVSVGTCALAFSLSLGLGLRAFIDTEFQGRPDFWRIIVHTDEPPPNAKDVPAGKAEVRGTMSDARRERIREALVDRYVYTHLRRPPVPLTPERLAAVAVLPDVNEVRTYRTGDGRVTTAGSDRMAKVSAVGGRLDDLRSRLIAGRLPASGDAREVVVTELVLYDLGHGDDADLERFLETEVKLEVGGVRNAQSVAMARALTGRFPEEITPAQAAVLGKLAALLPMRLDILDLTDAEKIELRRLLTALPDRDPDERPTDSGITVTDTYRVCGVVRILTRADRKKDGPLESMDLANGSAFLPPGTADALFLRLPWAKDAGFRSADVRVRPGGDVPGTVAAIEALGYRTYSAAKWFAGAKREVTLIAAGLNLFALIALFVAGIGITNTLVTSVVERTREIGILRAVGATRNQILGLFLAEGTCLGLAGGLLGLGLGWALTVPADGWVHGLIAQQMDGEKMLTTTLFVFPWWLWAGAVTFALVVTTVAAYYPARRAARIHPIEALRYA